MKIKSSHNCGLRKTTSLRLQIEQEAWKALQLFKAQIKKQVLMKECGKTRLLKMREENGSRKAITSLMSGEMGLQKTLGGIGRKIQVMIGPRKLQFQLEKVYMELMRFGMKMAQGKPLKIGLKGLLIHREC